MEVGGIKSVCFGNFLHPITLRRITENTNEFQFLFGFVC